jgi:integrase/recombinase XerD
VVARLSAPMPLEIQGSRKGCSRPLCRAGDGRCGCPTLKGRRISPHTLWHTTAIYVLRSGVDINTIRASLGHVSLATTNNYAEVDLEIKAQALAGCEAGDPGPSKPRREDAGLMGFLRNL